MLRQYSPCRARAMRSASRGLSSPQSTSSLGWWMASTTSPAASSGVMGLPRMRWTSKTAAPAWTAVPSWAAALRGRRRPQRCFASQRAGQSNNSGRLDARMATISIAVSSSGCRKPPHTERCEGLFQIFCFADVNEAQATGHHRCPLRYAVATRL